MLTISTCYGLWATYSLVYDSVRYLKDYDTFAKIYHHVRKYASSGSAAGHSTMAEALMSLAILSDNVTMHNQSWLLFNRTVDDYLR